MSAAQTIRFSATQAASQPWTPTDRDRLIFQWVKFDGEKQSIVATRLGMHQTTVSRILDRYERWIAHGGPSQQGGLSRDERIRAQRWLTYERNEWILNSALRIAGEMEIPADASRSTIKQAPQDPTKELEVRTQHFVLHRAGLAARFLRLAHRINMDQQKIVERDPLPDLEPLSQDDLAHSTPGHPPSGSAPREEIFAVTSPDDGLDDSPDSATTPTSGCHGHPGRADRADDLSPIDDRSSVPREQAETGDCPAPTAKPPEVPQSMHETHTSRQVELDVTDCSIDPYDQNDSSKKTRTPAYQVALSPPESMDQASSMGFTPPPKLPTFR